MIGLRRAQQRRRILAAGAVFVAALAMLTVTSANAAASPTGSGGFGALTPTRLLDTRTGNGAARRAVPGRGTIAVKVLGRGGVPASGVSAVVLNVTATGATKPGFVTVWADGRPRPLASSLNFLAGQTIPNQVIAPVGADGRVAFSNSSVASIELLADVSGYYLAGTPTEPGAFSALSPARLLDTRGGDGAPRSAVRSNGAVNLQVAGRGGVPAAGASAVVLNVTVTSPASSGFITVAAHGQARPTASNLNFVRGQTVANLVIAPLGTDGKVSLYNLSPGSSQLIADVAGYYLAGTPTAAGDFAPVAPARLLDSRSGNGVRSGAIPAHGAVLLQVAGRGGVPTTGVAAVEMNVTVVAPKTTGYLTVWPTGAAQPTASNLNFVRSQTVPNLVMAPVGPDGRVLLRNNSASTVQLLADVNGFFLKSALPVPPATTSRYVRNISGVSTDYTTMSSEGCADAQANGAGIHFELLQIGAQTITAPLSAINPGVLLSATQTRISYPNLVAALTGYTAGYSSCGGGSLTVAIGTSSDGDFSAYSALAKGAAWADQVIDPLQAASPGVTVQGANDIEAGFAATEAQAEQWESAYLAATSGALVLNGSADACPSAYGLTGRTCGAVRNDIGVLQRWTQAQYFRLTHSLNPARLTALPQIYAAAQAGQWANIALIGGSTSNRISFLGALTESGACGACSVPPAQGWAAFRLALATSPITAGYGASIVTDLRSDG